MNFGPGKNVAAFPEGGCCQVGLGLALHAPEFLLDGVVQTGVTGFLDALIANVEFLVVGVVEEAALRDGVAAIHAR